MTVAGRAGENAAGAPAAGTSKRLSGIGRDRLMSIASPLGLLVAWEVAARLHAIDTLFFPAPSSIAASLVALARSGELLDDTAISLQRMVLGFLLGGIPALVLGVVMGIYRPIRALVDPLIAATYAIP